MLLNDIKLFLAIKEVDADEIKKPLIRPVQGMPSCGKTTYILGIFKPNGSDLILCPTRERAEDVRDRLLTTVSKKIRKNTARTIDSYLMNADSKKVKRLIIDEALMLHVGAIVHAILKSGAEEVILIEDRLQIPFIKRLYHVIA